MAAAFERGIIGPNRASAQRGATAHNPIEGAHSDMTELRAGLPPLPKRFLKLPIDPRGYPVPWFVTRMQSGEWDFRVIRPNGIPLAIKRRTCWLCGEPLGRYLAFVVGPVCAVTRTTREPPNHYDCAEFAVKACPFLTNPAMRRSPRERPKDATDPPGVHLEKNPGVTCLWTTTSYSLFRAEDAESADGNPGVLIKVGDPVTVEWYAQGVRASRDQVEDSVNSDIPLLHARDPSEDAQRELNEQIDWFRQNILAAVT